MFDLDIVTAKTLYFLLIIFQSGTLLIIKNIQTQTEIRGGDISYPLPLYLQTQNYLRREERAEHRFNEAVCDLF